MKQIVTITSALVLALGVLSGCGEKAEEAPKAEAAAQQAATDASKAAGEAVKAADDAVKAAGEAATKSAEAAAQAVSNAAQDAGDAAKAASEKAAEAASDAAKAAGDAAAKAAETVAQAAPAGSVNGETVYKGLCFGCHDQGVMQSPKLGDKAAWEPRIATGKDALYASALNGKNAMPAKGGNPKLSDEEVKAAVDYMVAQVK